MKLLKPITLVGAVLLTTLAVIAQQAQLEPSAEKLQQHVSHLASDAMDGRRTGTAGANAAARYIATEFSRLGLKPVTRGPVTEGTARYLQTFPYVARVEIGKGNALSFGATKPDNSFTTPIDWVPLGFSANAKVEGGIVFAGFGITASELNHDDYSGLNANGKIAIVLQGTPDGENPHGRFTRFEGVRWKAVAARNAGAKALIVVAREPNFKNEKLAKLEYDNRSGDSGLPVIVVSQQAVDKILALSNTSSTQLQHNRALTGEISLTTNVVRKEVPAYNVVGMLEGSDANLKNEYIVIGAHYDHLGRGGEGSGSLMPDSSDIHHGADDNASGTAGLIELARVFSAQKPKLKRSVIFIAFGGEEEGLLGSNYYVNNPTVPLANTIAMINMDMIGRMKDRKLVIGGVGTAKEWRDIIKQANAAQTIQVTATTDQPPVKKIPIVVSSNGRPIMTVDPTGAFELTLNEDGYGPSDHQSFYIKQVPVLFFWTGTHNDYHKPSDTFDKINYNDEARILSLIARIVRDVDGAEKRLTYATAKSEAPRASVFRVYLGTIPNYADSTDGMLIDGVREESPAAKAGIKPGDRIVKIGTRDVKNVYEYTHALGEMKAGQEYVIEVMRAGERMSLKITPEARK